MRPSWRSIPARSTLLTLVVFASAIGDEPEASSTTKGETPSSIDFASQVAPLLAEHCIACHGPEKQKGGLRLDTHEFAKLGGDSGEVIEPGLETSELLRRMTTEDEEERMPPETALDSDAIVMIQSWIVEGAHWSDEIESIQATGAANTSRFRFPVPPSDEGVAIQPPAWAFAGFLNEPATSEEIDQLLNEYLNGKGIETADPEDRELFMKRLFQDVNGTLPPLKKVAAAVRSKSPPRAMRTYYVQRALVHRDFSVHWARWMRDVIEARATYMAPFVTRPRRWALEVYLQESIRDRKNWAEITRDLLTASGGLYLRERSRNGEVGFYQCHAKDDRIVESTNDISRVFLGINMQCAQCHDHPQDIWKRQQFHELGAFLVRLNTRVSVNRGDFITYLVSANKNDPEYMMPDQYDPTITTLTHPKLFTGGTPPEGLGDTERREALADYITSKDNFYFSAAFVNRVWAKLMGWGFYSPVENIGPLQEPIAEQVLMRLAAHFRATDYDIRSLYEVILCTDAYARKLRLPGTPDDNTLIAGVVPKPLPAEALWDCVNVALAGHDERVVRRHAYQPLNADKVIGTIQLGQNVYDITLRQRFNELFKVNTMLDPGDIEPTVTQAMVLMNNDTINAGISAKGDTRLAEILKASPEDRGAITRVYKQVMARKPTQQEIAACVDYIKFVGDRGEAYEDIVWTLINSTEFRIKR